MTVEKTHTWEKGFIGKLILDQSWLSKPTEDWLLELGFCNQVEEFKIWSATIVSPATQGNLVKNVEAVNITNVCWNGILYSCQSYEISFLVRQVETRKSFQRFNNSTSPGSPRPPPLTRRPTTWRR